MIDLDKINSSKENIVDIFVITSLTMKILDAKYEKSNLDAYLNLSSHLDASQKSNLKSLLLKYESLFNGSLGDWKTDPVDLQLKFRRDAFPFISFSSPKNSRTNT